VQTPDLAGVDRSGKNAENVVLLLDLHPRFLGGGCNLAELLEVRVADAERQSNLFHAGPPVIRV
jgi:hypothetical protein